MDRGTRSGICECPCGCREPAVVKLEGGWRCGKCATSLQDSHGLSWCGRRMEKCSHPGGHHWIGQGSDEAQLTRFCAHCGVEQGLALGLGGMWLVVRHEPDYSWGEDEMWEDEEGGDDDDDDE